MRIFLKNIALAVVLLLADILQTQLKYLNIELKLDRCFARSLHS